jgi:hypothetical protein
MAAVVAGIEAIVDARAAPVEPCVGAVAAALDAIGTVFVPARVQPCGAAFAAGLDGIDPAVEAVFDAIAAIGERRRRGQQQGQGEPGHRLHRALRDRGVATTRTPGPAPG